MLLPGYVAEGKSYLTIALGCTGGRHRRVAIAEEVATQLRRRRAASDRDPPLTSPSRTQDGFEAPGRRVPHTTQREGYGDHDIRVGINGFGRIGRNFFRAVKESGRRHRLRRRQRPRLGRHHGPPPASTTRHGRLPDEIKATDDGIAVDGDTFRILAERDPAKLPWADLGVDVVIESTGFFTDREKAAAHIEGGAPRVIVSAPATNADATFVVGVNDDTFDPSMKVVSNASCTTNCFVPMIKVLDDAFGVEKGLMTTIHAYTGDQNLVDRPHKDLRRARGAAINIVPTSTGAARATGLVLESMKGKLDGTVAAGAGAGRLDHRLRRHPRAARSPSTRSTRPSGAAAESGPLANVLVYTEDAIVSSRHRRLAGVVHVRLEAHDGDGQHGQGPRLVRQRVGLLEPARRPALIVGAANLSGARASR